MFATGSYRKARKNNIYLGTHTRHNVSSFVAGFQCIRDAPAPLLRVDLMNGTFFSYRDWLFKDTRVCATCIYLTRRHKMHLHTCMILRRGVAFFHLHIASSLGRNVTSSSGSPPASFFVFFRVLKYPQGFFSLRPAEVIVRKYPDGARDEIFALGPFFVYYCVVGLRRCAPFS